eukprot:c27923_g1_i2 orf=187-2037(+)
MGTVAPIGRASLRFSSLPSCLQSSFCHPFQCSHGSFHYSLVITCSPASFPARRKSRRFISQSTGHGFSGANRKDDKKKGEGGSDSPLLVQTANCVCKLKLEECLQRTYLALGLQDYSPEDHIVVTGRQVLFGMEGDWTLAWCMDGRFYERYDGTEITVEQGYDGEHNPWHADAGGRVTSADLDDMEVSLLSTWIRTGYWLSVDGRKKLTIELGGGLTAIDLYLADEFQVLIHLKNKKVVTYVTINLSTWLPIRMETMALGGVDKWEYSHWQCILPGCRCKFASSVMNVPPAGGNYVYTITSATFGHNDAIYLFPSSKSAPRYDKSYPCGFIDDTCLPSVKLIRAKSGHYLVRPHIDGQDIGYFIMDTGASGLFISPKKANEVAMASFGEIFVSGAEGKFRSQFRRGKRLQLGPLTVENPIFLEAPVDSVISGISDSVAGICGFDIYHHCVIEISNLEERLSLFDPLHYKPPKGFIKWETLYMLDNIPHATASFGNHSAIFLLDTGAGGVHAIFHNRAVEEFQLLSRLQCIGFAEVNGIGNCKAGIQVQYGFLHQFEFAGQSFQQVKVLFFNEGVFNLSVYTAGILCGDLLIDYLAIFDYSRHRFALIGVENGLDCN